MRFIGSRSCGRFTYRENGLCRGQKALRDIMIHDQESIAWRSNVYWVFVTHGVMLFAGMKSRSWNTMIMAPLVSQNHSHHLLSSISSF